MLCCTPVSISGNFYPRPPRGGRRPDRPDSQSHQGISIHALREEGDGECNYTRERVQEFLSTPSARRATAGSGLPRSRTMHFYPRPLRGGRPTGTLGTGVSGNFYPRPLRGERHVYTRAGARLQISIHALCEEGDKHGKGVPVSPVEFLSTPSARRATVNIA